MTTHSPAGFSVLPTNPSPVSVPGSRSLRIRRRQPGKAQLGAEEQVLDLPLPHGPRPGLPVRRRRQLPAHRGRVLEAVLHRPRQLHGPDGPAGHGDGVSSGDGDVHLLSRRGRDRAGAHSHVRGHTKSPEPGRRQVHRSRGGCVQQDLLGAVLSGEDHNLSPWKTVSECLPSLLEDAGPEEGAHFVASNSTTNYLKKGIVDCDIACPIPHTPDSFFSGDFDWFLCFVTHARLLSRACTSLFAVGVSHYPGDYYLDTIEQLTVELEDWRVSLPDNGFRPGGQTKAHSIVDDQERTLALATHFLYYSFLLTMTRMALRHLPSSEAQPDCARRESAMKTVEHSASSLLELVPIIDLAPYTPIWMMAGIPVMAFFVLFELVIHNPRQQQTAANLALLDVMSAHCNRMDVMSNGALPGDFIGEFAHIARSYVIEVDRRTPTGNTPQAPSNTLQASSFCPQWSLPNVDNYGFAPLQVQPGFSDMSPIPASHPAESMDADEMTMAASHPAGTDVMSLFGVWIPELEPMFYQGVLGQYDGGFTGAQQGLGPTPSLSYEYDNNS
ncbi:Fungal specific transcription factor domain containing protein [Colletotrichum higginsianum IMI 349063]|uniref:Fungal specific transcription factor domain containing protein n=1 Tax=Colletotrichum higginsianum (strain IMI 349063) TaxID=759273 RepID=A0A1B7YAP8_COLHI|nr:Fungal specific transcription factor domain containing protein [Colletotrichum higginsianum IMI 349063]OBR09152.1 Fungal specific transcription factor domain containing protein [Colletotrichum higginsianum IMI 349063]